MIGVRDHGLAAIAIAGLKLRAVSA